MSTLSGGSVTCREVCKLCVVRPLPLCAVPAAASGTTTITGIANQRVKECDRIAAMCSQLQRCCGVVCEELPDGLRITGAGSVAGVLPRPDTPVQCYQDHRVAMAFAALGCAVPGIVVGDSRCVEKTYPEFWDHLGRLGLAQVLSGDSGSRCGCAQSAPLPPYAVHHSVSWVEVGWFRDLTDSGTPPSCLQAAYACACVYACLCLCVPLCALQEVLVAVVVVAAAVVVIAVLAPCRSAGTAPWS